MDRIKLGVQDWENLKNGTGRLELGCGNIIHARMSDYPIGLDIEDFGQQIIWNLEKGIPLPDNSCEGVYASHIFEHLHQDKLDHVFNECWRVLKEFGILWVVVPSIENEAAYIPSHLSLWNEGKFKYFAGKLNPENTLNEFHRGAKEEVKLWTITELVTNKKLHIHCKLTPQKNVL